MSFDLFVWDPPTDASDDDVRERYQTAGESTGEPDDVDLEAGVSERATQFFEAVARLYPPLEDLAGEAMQRSPWSCSPARGDRWVSFTIRWGGTVDEVIPHIDRLARDHHLVLYDQQGGQVYWPDRVTDR